ncbi:hypothetical protein DFH07DRAFT_756993 [Mycena maculata]|uniref:Uncharacterized protein n=1 Tax=Mycena maculata TaxID=230809 RepID=A0AAD7HV66_9AGAR|nr:hypothetical protein DFH07DRAFT_756993 [Mycena maculata]
MGAKYLCCLPLRLGVLVISFIHFVASAFASAILIYALVLDSQGPIAIIVLSIICGLDAFISLTGFIGAIRKKKSHVASFSSLLRSFFVIQVVSVIAYFVLYFVDKSQFRKLCIGDSTDQNVINACDSPSKLSLWILVVSAIVPLLFQAYGLYVVSSYVRQLRNESLLQQESFGFEGPDYARVPEESHPLTYQPGYPYADNAHSFGAGQV